MNKNEEKKIENKVKIIDKIPGGGKTEFIFSYMKKNIQNMKYFFVTPYLTEVDRALNEIPDMKEPKGRWKSKDLLNIIKEGHNVAITHSLFYRASKEIIELIEKKGYTLVLDEVIDVVSVSQLRKNDKKALIEIGLLEERDGVLKEGDDKIAKSYNDSEWAYMDIINGLKRKVLEVFNNNVLVWKFPIDTFKAFKEVFILTYMFEGYPIAPYFRMEGVEYEKYGIIGRYGSYEIAPYFDQKHGLSNSINILETGKINDIGNKKASFSDYWYKNMQEYELTQIKKNVSNIVQNISDYKIKDVLWTTFKKYKDSLLSAKAKDKSFIAHNTRATNNYSDKKLVAYLVSRNYNPIIKRWFQSKGVEVDNDSFALSEMIQFVFRSRIRNGEHIDLYCPSHRMRKLFSDWLKND